MIHENSLMDLIQHLQPGEGRPIWVETLEIGADIQRRVLAKSRYPKEMRGRQFTTKLSIMHPINNALDTSFWVLVTRES